MCCGLNLNSKPASEADPKMTGTEASLYYLNNFCLVDLLSLQIGQVHFQSEGYLVNSIFMNYLRNEFHFSDVNRSINYTGSDAK